MVAETGKITIRDLEFNCIIGTLPYERENVQPVVMNISVWLDFTLAARNEDLAHSIDYVQLADDVQDFVCRSSFQLEPLPQDHRRRGFCTQAASNSAKRRCRIQHQDNQVKSSLASKRPIA